MNTITTQDTEDSVPSVRINIYMTSCLGSSSALLTQVQLSEGSLSYLYLYEGRTT